MKLSAFAIEALARRAGDGEPALADFEGAIRFYLKEKATGAASWAYPEFLRDRTASEEVELELSLEEGLWERLGKEAVAQGVSVERLLEHAMLYYAAEVDAGRATERILGDLDAE